jgi:hypothetical protein
MEDRVIFTRSPTTPFTPTPPPTLKVPMRITPPKRRPRGLTLVELTVMIIVLLSLITVLFIGCRAWKRGSGRSGCILNIRNVPLAGRSYQNIYGYTPGASPSPEFGSTDISEHLHQKEFIADGLYQSIEGNKPCPGGGSYVAPAKSVFPQPGELYISCSLAGTDRHGPADHGDW